MKYKLLIIILLSSCYLSFSQSIKINDSLEIKKISNNIYLHISTTEIKGWGSVSSNGILIVDNKKAFLVDTPSNTPLTQSLVNWISNTLNAEIVGFVPGHWHGDCVGGMEYLNQIGIKTYANHLTNNILIEKARPTAQFSFQDSINIPLNNINIKCYYLGGGHTPDNIVVWIPSEKVLFGGCMVKDCNANSLGNTADAVEPNQWKATINKLLTNFNNATLIIPGHGEIGNAELLNHTVKLIENNSYSN